MISDFDPMAHPEKKRWFAEFCFVDRLLEIFCSDSSQMQPRWTERDRLAELQALRDRVAELEEKHAG